MVNGQVLTIQRLLSTRRKDLLSRAGHQWQTVDPGYTGTGCKVHENQPDDPGEPGPERASEHVRAWGDLTSQRPTRERSSG